MFKAIIGHEKGFFRLIASVEIELIWDFEISKKDKYHFNKTGFGILKVLFAALK